MQVSARVVRRIAAQSRGVLEKTKKPRKPVDWASLPDNALMLFDPVINSEEELAAFQFFLTSMPCKYNLVKLTFAVFRGDYAGRSGGCATGPLSNRVLTETRVFTLFNKLGVSMVTLTGLHTQTFHLVSKGRSAMSMDLYCRSFVPQFVGKLEKIVRCPGSLMPAFLNAFVCLVFRKDGILEDKLRGRALAEFTTMNSEYFRRKND